MLDSLFELLTSAQGDSLRNWIATIVGLVALFIATNTYRRNVRIKREEQARLVYSKMTHLTAHEPGDVFDILPNGAVSGTGTVGMAYVDNPDPALSILGHAIAPLLQVTAVLHNGSKELIGPARIQLVDGGTGRVRDEFSMTIDTAEPETDFIVDFTWINEHHPGQPSITTTVIFRDASGQWWRRHSGEQIEHVHDDPENFGPTPRERVDIRRHQRKIGIDEANFIAEPRLTLRVRVHRLVRLMRGRTPLP